MNGVSSKVYVEIPNVNADAWCKHGLRVRIHEVSASVLRQLCDNTSDNVLIEISVESLCNAILEYTLWFSIINSMVSVLAELLAAIDSNDRSVQMNSKTYMR